MVYTFRWRRVAPPKDKQYQQQQHDWFEFNIPQINIELYIEKYIYIYIESTVSVKENKIFEW